MAMARCHRECALQQLGRGAIESNLALQPQQCGRLQRVQFRLRSKPLRPYHPLGAGSLDFS